MAAAFKLKGNDAFKSGNFAAAVGAYTDAMLADPKDPTLPLNRAAAYLKLNKFQDAERDCGKVLLFDPKNIKALFRRGQARAGLGDYTKALVDLDQVLSLEASNQVAKQEKARVQELLERSKLSKRAESRIPIDVSTTVPRRRRVPIDIVEDEILASQTSKPEEKPLSPSSNKKPLIEEISPSTNASTFKSFHQVKEERETRITRIVGGGILKKDGSNMATIFEPRAIVHASESTNSDVASQPILSVAEQPSKPPTNSFEFQRKWNSTDDLYKKWLVLQSLSPETLPNFFKSSLEPPLLGSILEVILHVVTGGSVASTEVASYLKGLGRIPRFDTLILFLSPKEKSSTANLLQLVGENVGWRI
ncbi:RNA polymerase II-associated protein 3 [Serendipita sp. 411]|nr:RNA polymerase II-associated protein 3 [Serendipita sp. 411]